MKCSIFEDIIILTCREIPDFEQRTRYFLGVLDAFKMANLIGMLDARLKELDAAFAKAYDQIK